MKLNAKTISLISTFANLGLTILKLIVGLLSSSVALIAEALHSGLDIASSFITFLGIRVAEKPKDKEHRYGYGGYEGIASFVVALLLFISAIWILYEATMNLIYQQHDAQFTVWGIGVMALSALTNEVLARLKFKGSAKYSSLALAADAEHSRADVISSIAVLVGLFLVKYFSLADSILAILVALYILFEAYTLSREAIDSLTDKVNPELDKKIEEWLEKNQVKYSDLKTRKIGSASFAEIELVFDSKTKAEEITKTTKAIEKQLVENFHELRQVSLSVDSHEFSENVTISKSGETFRFRQPYEKIGPPKPILNSGRKVERVIVPLENNKIAPDFGAKEYFLIDLDDKGNKINKTKVINKYYEINGASHGSKFAKSVSADKIIVRQIGQSAQKNLESQGIKVQLVTENRTIERLL